MISSWFTSSHVHNNVVNSLLQYDSLSPSVYTPQCIHLTYLMEFYVYHTIMQTWIPPDVRTMCSFWVYMWFLFGTMWWKIMYTYTFLHFLKIEKFSCGHRQKVQDPSVCRFGMGSLVKPGVIDTENQVYYSLPRLGVRKFGIWFYLIKVLVIFNMIICLPSQMIAKIIDWFNTTRKCM